MFDPTTGKTAQQLLLEKVEKVAGKQLSTNDYTTAEKNKLAGIAAGANNYTLPSATTAVRGGVVLDNTTSSTDATKAATAAALKLAYDLANTANIKASPTNLDGRDMNTIKTHGVYYGYNMINSAQTNISVFEVLAYSPDWIVQIQHVIPAGTIGDTFKRSWYNGDSWSPWVKISNSAGIDSKVDKVSGKQLSTNDYTTVEKNKLAGIATGAQVNAVTSVAGKTGAVTLTKADVGLGNVDNTSDLAKPISTATQTVLNTKANSTDLTSLQTTVTQHLNKSASEAHGAVRKEYPLFGGTLTNGSAILEMPSGFTSLNDFNEIIIVGTMARNNSGTWRHFTEIMKPISAINQQSFSVAHEMIFTTTETNKYWLRCVIDKSTKQLSVTYNRSKAGNAVGVDGTENAIGGVIGVKYN
ncbi:MAG: pyocin knob domain-containing protein [Solibacillus sp.]